MPPDSAMRERLQRVIPAVIGLVLFLVALEVLRHELRAASWRTISSDVLAMPRLQLVAAILLTLVNYAVLTGYDFLAFAYIGRKISRARIALASFLAYAIANNVGLSVLSGVSVRYRFYTRWGVTAEELSRIVMVYSITFWLGLLALGGISLAVSPVPRAHGMPAADALAGAGVALAGVSLAYVLLAIVRVGPIRIGRFFIPLPSPALALGQLGVSMLDWTLAGTVFYVLLPAADVSFVTVLGAFLAAQLLGLGSHVPGGLGVFEGVIVLLLGPYFTSAQLVPSLVVYRAVYYLLPLSIALVLLVADELRLRRAQAARATAYLGWLSEQLTPRVLAFFTFLAGVVLLFSGATPAAEGRLARLGRMLPLGLIETSHFIGSLVGAALLLLSQGLARRLDAAYYFTAAAVAVGAGASILKGGDYEEALLLVLLLLVLRRARPAFDRKAAFFETTFSPAWIAAVAAALAASVWLGLFAFKHVEYSQDLWWQFEVEGEASRFLRATVGAATVVLLFALARLMGHAPHDETTPTDDDLETARAAIEAQRETSPYLVFLRDKALIFDERRRGFVMYAVQGRTWVALGDPVGPPEALPDLIRLFLERCDDFGGTPVFYEVRKEHLHHYADFGLTFVKLGEEARVDLAAFTLQGGHGARHRQAIRRVEKEGARFRMVAASEVPSIVGRLRDVSDDWLAQKAAGEKGFSLGFFDAAYLSRFPVGVIEYEGRIDAFANVWPGPGREELSVDLMRYHHRAPKGVMEALLVYIMEWGRSEGYRWFALGMAPMSGLEQSPVAPLWNRLGVFLYEHGEALYNFQGLRAYKQKFDPVWEPHYLAYPGGLRLPRVLADVAALIAGGYRRIFIK